MVETTQNGDTEEPWRLLEKRQVFSRSLLWDLQQSYFAQKGVEAWRQGEVPQYVTSNPTIANGYAEIVFSFWRDQNRLIPGVEASAEPLYIAELGAGSGRFAFHFLSRLKQLCDESGVAPASFRYVLTDMALNNLDFWRSHPGFQPFFESGLLDIAPFDILSSDELALRISGKQLIAGGLERPIVVIANYVFDTIPQELFHVGEQGWSRCLVSLYLDVDPGTLPISALLQRLACQYDYERLHTEPYEEEYLQQIMRSYRATLRDTHLLFPAAGLGAIDRLRALSQQGLMLLSADKGDHRLSALEGNAAPGLAYHGSFSLNVNYHAYKTYAEQSGGIALFPSFYHKNVDVNCLLMTPSAGDYVETKRAYRRHVEDFSPDDFYSVMKHAQQYVEQMTVEDILAYLRLSYFDSQQFALYLPRLRELASTLTSKEHETLRAVVDRVWDLYFPLGEDLDLADQIAVLLYWMDDYQGALTYFDRSIAIYGENSGTLFNMAACYRMLDRHEKARLLLRNALRLDPDNAQARALLADYTARRKRPAKAVSGFRVSK